MTMFRMPIFTWNIFVTSLLILMTFPVLTAAGAMLFFDRHFDAHIFDAAYGGVPVLWQHLFWWFGHPEVVHPRPAVLRRVHRDLRRVLPPAGVRLQGRSSSPRWPSGSCRSGVWAHHMFTTGAVLLPFFCVHDHAHRRADRA